MAYNGNLPATGGPLVAADIRENFRALKDDGIVTSVDKIWTYQDTAPTGWSIVAGTEDGLLAVKGGTNAYNANGGTRAGTWTQPNHTLTVAEIPSHMHSVSFYISPGGSLSGLERLNDAGYSYITTNSSYTGGGGAHNHGTTYRPLSNLGIIIEKA